MTLPGIRLTNLLIFLLCVGLLAYAYYSQLVLGLHPCPLCISQRIFVALVGIAALIAAIHNPARLGRRLYTGFAIAAGILGAIVAGRHVWIQNLPADQVPACGPSLNYILETFPLTEAIAVLFRGDGNCADVVWNFLGLSMPAWVLIAFIGLIAVNLWQWVRAR